MGRSADYSKEKCAIAASVDLVGEPWTLLIIRNAFMGHSRFEQWQKSLGVARNVLAARLKRLVALDIMRAEAYSQRPLRYEYVLTPKGQGLLGVIMALYSWGREHVYESEAVIEMAHDDCAHDLHTTAHCTHCDATLTPQNVLKLKFHDEALTLAELYEKKGIVL
ncbi:helix-turn-helix domain-containing protein [Asticcacaulis sp. BYS171W]|uniref:Helix-turn-helix domain-containing protein n=1 Tax=Asticcacaulis aquaticus TaxID=2984212 RepID=A0ABT5HSY5_9CAUL|nr:helix-turn-helix domain-containing protein [Asticcacaulis aquaticus]MDC7683171.1 helix-turn-helix domain-containing protein [Asticcacaulis aquaticus]